MLAKSLIVIALIFILAGLAAGLYYLLKDPSRSPRTVKALTWRFALSILLFLLLLLGYATGFLHPHGLAKPVEKSVTP